MTGIAARAAVLRRGSFPALAVLYFLLYGAFGSESPFFPLFLQSRGRTAAEIGLILSASTIVRLCVGPGVGILADRVGIRLTLAVAATAAGLVGLGYLAVASFAGLLAVAMLHACALTSLAPLCDALVLSAAAREKTFAYGWVRGVGSGSFVLATLVSGAIVGAFGIASIIVASSLLNLAMLGPLRWLTTPARTAREGPPLAGPPLAGIVDLLRIPAFRQILLVGALVIGSQSMSDTFAAIHWREAGISSTMVGALWSEAVAAELLVFLVIGPMALRRFGPGRCAMAGALAGIVQWGALASTTNPVLLALGQPLHGLTFALTHLSCMAVIAATVPSERAATAQAIYGTLCLGLASALVTSASGVLWGAWGAHAFWTMAALCLIAVPLAATMKAATMKAGSPDPATVV